MYKLSQIAEITGAQLAGDEDYGIHSFIHDSRSIQLPQGALFIALKSARNNAHRYIPEMVKRGFRSFLVEKGEAEIKKFPSDVSFLISENPLAALQKLASFHRSQFRTPVIGITGSNGKTVVKEWLYQLLKNDYKICRSPKSFNSQIGVPLSLLNLGNEHNLGIFEAGISAPGEMQRLREMIQPTIGVLTSLGSAHDEGFENTEQKLREKLMLFANCKQNILNAGDYLSEQLSTKKNLVIGTEGNVRLSATGKKVNLQTEEGKLEFTIPFSDKASQKNAATCAMVLKTLGYSNDEICARMKNLQTVALRLEIRNGIYRSLIINDYYNSDLDSFKIALDHLEQQNRRTKKVIVVSDIEQSGLEEKELYTRMAQLLGQHKPDLLIGIGEKISNNASLFSGNALFFKDTMHFISSMPSLEERLFDATILLKGARSFGFETISRRLQQKSHDTVFEIDLGRVVANVNYYRSLLKPGVQLMCMIKAMGYGSGGPEIARTLQHIGVNYLAVAYADEGVELRESQITLPVMVMNPETEAFDDIISFQLEPELYSMRVLEAFAARVDALGVAEPFPVHLKIDTGMRRLGFAESDITDLLNALEKFPQLKVQSVFSHLAGSEDPQHDPFTLQQMATFKKACDRIEAALSYKVIRHISNSAGITRFPDAHLDMVRLGIGMYGVGSGALDQQHLQLVGTLKTRISQIRHLSAGETVGYGRRGVITDAASVAVIPIGYADGFSRMLGNGTHGVYINDHFCRTIGNICMDMCMIDVTAVPCNEGDEVIIFSTIEHLQALARALHTITYEVLTNVSARVKRVYVQE